jgi:DNA adenine methylase
LLARLKPLTYDLPTFEWSRLPGPPGEDEVEAAARVIVSRRWSRGGHGKHLAWSERTRGGLPGDLNSWLTFLDMLPAIGERLAGVELRCQDALSIIEEFDGPDVCFYLDTPYWPESRSSRAVYTYELDAAAHIRLLETIVRCRGAVAISGYPNDTYDEALRGWERSTKPMANHSGQGKVKQGRVEVLWFKSST